MKISETNMVQKFGGKQLQLTQVQDSLKKWLTILIWGASILMACAVALLVWGWLEANDPMVGSAAALSLFSVGTFLGSEVLEKVLEYLNGLWAQNERMMDCIEYLDSHRKDTGESQ